MLIIGLFKKKFRISLPVDLRNLELNGKINILCNMFNDIIFELEYYSTNGNSLYMLLCKWDLLFRTLDIFIDDLNKNYKEINVIDNDEFYKTLNDTLRVLWQRFQYQNLKYCPKKNLNNEITNSKLEYKHKRLKYHLYFNILNDKYVNRKTNFYIFSKLINEIDEFLRCNTVEILVSIFYQL